MKKQVSVGSYPSQTMNQITSQELKLQDLRQSLVNMQAAIQKGNLPTNAMKILDQASTIIGKSNAATDAILSKNAPRQLKAAKQTPVNFESKYDEIDTSQQTSSASASQPTTTPPAASATSNLSLEQELKRVSQLQEKFDRWQLYQLYRQDPRDYIKPVIIDPHKLLKEISEFNTQLLTQYRYSEAPNEVEKKILGQMNKMQDILSDAIGIKQEQSHQQRQHTTGSCGYGISRFRYTSSCSATPRNSNKNCSGKAIKEQQLQGL